MDIITIVLCLFLILIVPLAFLARVIVRTWYRRSIVKRLQELEATLCDRSIPRWRVVLLIMLSRRYEFLRKLKGYKSILSDIRSGHRERALQRVSNIIWDIVEESKGANIQYLE